MRFERLLLACTALFGGCAQIVGANFDVVASGTGGGSQVETIATDAFPFGITIDGDYIYWTATGPAGATPSGAVRRRKKDGTGPIQNLATNEDGPDRITISGGRAYWTTTPSTPGIFGDVMTVDEAGTTTPITVDSGLVSPLGIAVSGNQVFYSTKDNGGNGTFLVYKNGLMGGSRTTFATLGGAGLLVVHQYMGTEQLWGTTGDVGGTVWMAPITGPGAGTVTIVRNFPSATGIAEFTGGVIAGQFANGPAAQVVYFDYPSGSSTLTATDNQVASVAVDATYGYWASFGDGAIRRSNHSGGTVETIVPNQPSANGLAIDQGYIYWTTYNTNGAVLRMKLPP